MVDSALSGSGQFRRIAIGDSPAGKPVMLVIVFICLLVPVILSVGALNLHLSRALLLLMFFPMLFSWASGKTGPVHMVDFAVFAAALWSALALIVAHGFSNAIEPVGYQIVETVGGYMVGRVLIRSPETFRSFVKINFIAIMILMPFAIIETQTGEPPIIHFFSNFVNSTKIITYEARLGLERAQVVFPHPILYGVFCAAPLGMVIYVLNFRAATPVSILRAFGVVVAAFCSVSTGAIMILSLQYLFVLYDHVTRQVKSRWLLLLAAFVFVYVAIDLASNRTPFHVFVSYLTLNQGTSYTRILIFDYGIQNVWANPIFGLGQKDWVRPFWLRPSVDNFWLLMAMRYGIPGFLLFIGSFILLIIQLAFRPFKTERMLSYRKGYLISLIGLMFALATVHIWLSAYVWFMMMLGAGVWMLDYSDDAGDQAGDVAPAGDGRGVQRARFGKAQADEPVAVAVPTSDISRYTRFPAKPGAEARAVRAPHPRKGR
jgi:hypothetical protein